jgi:hypothetical protein
MPLGHVPGLTDVFMSIQFACQRCGHPIEVGDHFAGLRGRCKHCGHETEVPARAGPGAEGLHLRPLEGPGIGAGVDDRVDEGDGIYGVLDPKGFEAGRWWPFHSRRTAGPTTRLARIAARLFRVLRDWLYVLSLVCLGAAVLGFVARSRPLLHLGAAGVVLTNLGMLAAGLFYLVTLPFRDGPAVGLAALLLPPYTVHYWVTHWARMRKPVVNTLRSFAPIALIGLAYLFYEESPALERGAERVEEALRDQEKALERLPVPGLGPSDAGPAREATAPSTGEAP